MSEKELSILVRAKGVAKAISDIGKLNSSIGKLGSTAKQGFLNLGANIAKFGLIAGGALGAGVVAGVKSLEDLERVTNATAGVLASTGGVAGVTAGQVRDLANSLEGVTTVDDKVIQGGENLLLTFTGIGKDVFPQATKAMTDMALAMAEGDVSQVDLKGTAIQLGKALNDPVRGLTSLRRVGVAFTADQEKQIKTLVKSGDTLGAQKIILAELEKEFGKAGEAAGTGFGADIRRVKDAVEDAEQALAVGFLPLIRKVADWLKTKLADKGTLAAIRDFGTKLAGGFDKLLTAVSRIPWDTIGSGLKTAGEWAGKLFDAFLNLPPQFQSTIIALAGLNKLTGGAIGSIVSQLGSGLIKGVLGMNAGVVNINAATVNGGGLPGAGAAGAGGLRAALGSILTVGLPLLIGAGFVAAFWSAMQQTPDNTGTPGEAFSRGHGFGPRSGHGREGDVTNGANPGVTGGATPATAAPLPGGAHGGRSSVGNLHLVGRLLQKHTTGGGEDARAIAAGFAASTSPSLVSMNAHLAKIRELIPETKDKHELALLLAAEKSIKTSLETKLGKVTGGLSPDDRDSIRSAATAAKDAAHAASEQRTITVTVNTSITANAVTKAQRQTFRVGNTGKVFVQ